ncbi:MAG: PEP-CTERM sorting domain-containing protein [Phycisphaera sp.]|nr:PEP-CTERM sorting domain-containing protein [Phycisphaera sp.]
MSTQFNLKCLGRGFLVLATMVGAASPVLAATTFTGGTSTAWSDGTNWDAGLPTSGVDATIGDGKTAVVTSAYLDANPFGTLTLGVNSTLQLSAAGKTGLPANQTVNLSNGSYLQFTAGDINRTATYNVLAGATASFKPGNAGSDTVVSGSATGAADSVLNIDISNVTFFRTRWSNASFLGTMNYSAGSNPRQVDLSSFATANTAVGPGTTSFGNNVYAALGASNRMSDSATVKFVGAAGGSNIKFTGGVDRSDTIKNLIIESPVANSAAYIQMRNGFLKATTGVTFQGTAGTVRIDNALGGASSFKAGVDATGANVVFSGTGDWAITGSGQLKTNASTTITTNTNATLSNYLQGTTSFTKNGNGTLTLNGPLTDFTGTINVTAGTLAAQGAIKGISVSTNAALTIGTASSAADTLTIGTSGLTLGNNSAINWQFKGATTAGTDYDTIVQGTGALDLTGKSITLNGTALDSYVAQIGDTFTLFNGTVTGFDANNFTLNLPTPGSGAWSIAEGSLVLSVVAIPEPSVLVVLLTGFGLLGSSLRRRRN